MPSGQGLKLSTLSISEERYERQRQRLENLKGKVSKINHAAVHQIVDKKECTVLECKKT
jgi:hypothetical protein